MHDRRHDLVRGGFAPLWCGVLSGTFILQGSLGVVIKLLMDRPDDLVHNGLHVFSGLLGLSLLAWRRHAGARAFALGFGFLYLGLGILGWFWSNPIGVLPLGPADHIFHLIVGALTFGVGLWAVVSARTVLPAMTVEHHRRSAED